MAYKLVSNVLEQLASLFVPQNIVQEAVKEVRQVVDIKAEVQKLTETLQSVQAVLVDAENRQVKEEAVKLWLGKLKDLSYDMDDVLDEWNTQNLRSQIAQAENALPPPQKKVRYDIPFLSSVTSVFKPVVTHRDFALKIKELNERLNSLAFEQRRYDFKSIPITEEQPVRPRSTSFVDELEVYGRDKEKKTIVSDLLCGSSQEERGFHIISIVGMGGIGKTTLSQLAYNDDAVKTHFEKRIWVCVSDPFDELKIARDIATALYGSDSSSLNLEITSQRIHKSIAGKKFLLVLDDVWPHDYKKGELLAHPLRSGLQGSRILVTTRNMEVAKRMGTTCIHQLEELSKEFCWSVFSQMAFLGRRREDRENLEEIGRKISDKCQGLPLAAKTLGSLMRLKETKQQWQNVLKSKMWELEDVQKGLLAPLLLSYYDLPPALKRCFSYCAIFPKDYNIRRDTLIKLWMAQGYLRSSRQSMEMEMTGEEYFEGLSMRSFFQDFEKSEDDGSIFSCKMHDIVHDFAQFLTKNECFIMEVDGGKEPSTDSSYTKCRHASVVRAGNASFPVSIFNRGNLHTLLVLDGKELQTGNALPDVFRCLKFLRALDLSCKQITKLPEEVGTLMHLRYLDLSWNNFEELPESVCDLCNLQTLYLVGCGYLKELPRGIEKLINLRDLQFQLTSKLGFLPKEITRLSSLRILSDFIVSGVDKREACKLEDLKNLNHLQKALEIRGLGNVGDVGEAEKAELKSKEHLLTLALDFSPEEAKGKTEDLLEALQPHPNLKCLEIGHYGGPQLFPSWMTQLTTLKSILLYSCPNIVCLPPLGKLLFLERLRIGGMDSVKKVGVEFLGVGINDNGGTTDKDDGTGGASVTIAFPKLKHLELYHMEEWEEWDAVIAVGKTEEEITIMPCLRSLAIWGCPKLKALPHHFRRTSLEKLEIRRCPILKQRAEEGGEISHIPNICFTDY